MTDGMKKRLKAGVAIAVILLLALIFLNRRPETGDEPEGKNHAVHPDRNTASESPGDSGAQGRSSRPVLQNTKDNGDILEDQYAGLKKDELSRSTLLESHEEDGGYIYYFEIRAPELSREEFRGQQADRIVSREAIDRNRALAIAGMTLGEYFVRPQKKWIVEVRIKPAGAASYKIIEIDPNVAWSRDLQGLETTRSFGAELKLKQGDKWRFDHLLEAEFPEKK